LETSVRSLSEEIVRLEIEVGVYEKFEKSAIVLSDLLLSQAASIAANSIRLGCHDDQSDGT